MLSRSGDREDRPREGAAAPANPIHRALRRLAPRRSGPAAWRVGPSPAPASGAGQGRQRFVLLAGGPVELLVDEALVTVGEGAVLDLGPEETRRLVILDDGRDPVWLSLGHDEAEARR